jgi:hypothetical protein
MQHAQPASHAAQISSQFFSRRNIHAIQALGVAEQGFFALQILLPSALQSRLNSDLSSAARAASEQTETVLRATARRHSGQCHASQTHTKSGPRARRFPC